MFNPHELQLLLSGDKGKIDILDLRKNVVYGSGYHDQQPYIQSFWSLLESFSYDDQSAFLKFVTSCPRQPLLGFSELKPKFGKFCSDNILCYRYLNVLLVIGIQKVPTYENADNVARLPSAATCMNLLKLPQYDNIETLKEKLLYAIKSNSGFELS